MHHKFTNKPIMWNHRIHEHWGKERLYYWSLSFLPTYNQTEVFNRIKSLTIELGITSYGIYEMSGNIDIYLRLWLPTTITVEELKKALDTRLQINGMQLNINQSFAVISILRHWVWSDEKGMLIEPVERVLTHPFNDELISKINQRNITNEELEEYHKQHIVAPVNFANGIKFIIVVPTPPQNPTTLAVQGLENRIMDTLSSATRLTELSLYSGTGFGSYIVQGKVDPNHFESINDELIKKINDFGLQSFFGVRTYTHFVINTGANAVDFTETLPLTTNTRLQPNKPIEEFLTLEESESLEFKGSLSFNLSEWAHHGKLQEDDKLINEGVMKSIVSFLNSLKGGALVIGVLEEIKFNNVKERTRIDSLPKVGRYLIYGLDTDYKGKDWDSFQLRLSDLIKNRIDPDPRIWLVMRKETVNNKDICIVTIQTQTEHWFYLKNDPVFYVREGNRVSKYSGKEADFYKQNLFQAAKADR